MLSELCGTTCQHNSVISKTIITMLHYRVLFFFSQKQTAQFFGITLQLCGIVCEDKQDERPRSAPAGVLALQPPQQLQGCCIGWWESGKETFEAGRIGQRCSCVHFRVSRES